MNYDNQPIVIGSVFTSVEEMRKGRSCDLTKGGQLVIEKFETYERASFVDYLRSGWQVSLSLAIDYTGSNGNPSSPSSLHYLGPNN